MPFSFPRKGKKLSLFYYIPNAKKFQGIFRGTEILSLFCALLIYYSRNGKIYKKIIFLVLTYRIESDIIK
jgi:hypothetical protein